LVTINQLVLEESIDRVYGESDTHPSVRCFDPAIRERAGKAVGQQVNNIIAELRTELSEEVQRAIDNAWKKRA
jgi:hypothetical protein